MKYPFVFGEYWSFVHPPTNRLQKNSTWLSGENSTTHGSDESRCLFLRPSLCHRVWFGSGYWTQTEWVAALRHLAMTIPHRVCRALKLSLSGTCPRTSESGTKENKTFSCLQGTMERGQAVGMGRRFPDPRTAAWESGAHRKSEAGKQSPETLSLWSLRPEITLTFS